MLLGLLGVSWVALGASWGALGPLGSLLGCFKSRECVLQSAMGFLGRTPASLSVFSCSGFDGFRGDLRLGRFY